MKNRTYWLIIAALCLVIGLGSGVLVYRHVRQGETSYFAVEDGAGNTVDIRSFRGSPVIVNFWASWCGPCQAEMPEFEEAYQEYGDDIVFMMVNLTDGLSDTRESADAVIAEGGYTFPVYYDTTGEAANAYGISAIPVTIFIDSHGKLVYQKTGMMDGEELQAWIDTLLN